MDFQFMKKIRETITRNASNTIYKAINKIQQDNQQERGIPNQVGNNRDKLYCNIIQDRLSWDKGDVIPDKSELLICFHRPRIQPIRKTWRNISKERKSYDCISWLYLYVPFYQAINNQKGSDILCKKNHRCNQENHQSMPGSHPLWNEIHSNLLLRRVLWIPRRQKRITTVRYWWIWIGFPSRPGCVLNFWKIQGSSQPQNLLQNLLRWRTSSF